MTRTGVGQLSHKLHFFSYTQSTEARRDPVPKLMQPLQRLAPSITKCSSQRLSMSVYDLNLC